MNAEELLKVIRRDVSAQIRNAMVFSISSNYAGNLRDAKTVSDIIDQWLDKLIETNLDKEANG